MTGYLSNAPLGRCCTFLTGGRARRLAFCYNISELAEAAAGGALVLGRGSNILLGDAGYDGDVVINRSGRRSFTPDTCECDSGVLLSALAREYMQLGRHGLEWAYGLPGTVGGAIVGNAGAFGGSIADSVVSVTVLSGGKIKTLGVRECGFGYRHSDIKGTVLSVILKADAGDRESVKLASEQNILRRRELQPLGASAGSVFKKTEMGSAGELIEKAGIKGLGAGGAQISDKHANFIVNRGGALSGDILQLINTAQAAVFDKFGIELKREIKLYGDFY